MIIKNALVFTLEEGFVQKDVVIENELFTEESIGVDDVCGSIGAGKYGDCVILSKEDLSTREVILGGEVVKR